MPAPNVQVFQRDPETPPFGITARRDMFGFTLQNTSIAEGRHSNLMSQATFYGQDGNPLGYVEVSEGPEYGRNILNSVIRGWGIASLIALLASAGIGWLISRQITRPIVLLEQVASEMKEGNLTVRAPSLKPAELASLSETFNGMAIRIENNIKALRRFVADAAHELRTPLTALRADLDLAIREQDGQKAKDLASRSLEQVTRLDQLSKDLLDLSKIETGSDSASFQPIDLVRLLRAASEFHASAAEQAGIDFQIDLPEVSAKVLGNDLQLQRAVSNLLENAVKFTPAGGRVVLKLDKEDGWAFITVEDNGIGIPPDERELLFSRFHRGRNSYSYPGSGLGLAIAKAIVEKHYGEIGLLPSVATTCFYIRIPLI
jgi:two-component system OmpR family sensor kinase